ncbi:MAG TPA: cupin domain-containing protein [Puia sp.]|nr:cupin domain-containing protein [Puia sp.]
MDIKAYIESGIIQDYCLGILSSSENAEVEKNASLHTEVKNEIEAYQKALEKYSMSFAQNVPANLKSKTLGLLDNLAKEKNAQPDHLPLLNKFSDYHNWLRIVKPLLPSELKKDTFIKVLREEDDVMQIVMWVKNYYPDEVHHDLDECFMILEGECECHVEDKIIKLGAGDFFDVPLHKHHDVKVTKGPVLAVVQRLKVA